MSEDVSACGTLGLPMTFVTRGASLLNSAVDGRPALFSHEEVTFKVMMVALAFFREP